VKGDDKRSLSIRGCMFEQTCARELFMTEYIQTFCGVRVGNEPLGFYRYPTELPPTTNREWKWECPSKVEKFCAVFETGGDKRLGDHLLNGLERLYAKFSKVSEKMARDAETFLKSNGRWKEGDEECWDTSVQVECGGNVIDGRSFKHAVDFSILSRNCECQRFKQVWDENLRYLIENGTLAWIFLQLAFRLGYECGETMRLLAEGRVSWGTFPDEMGIHCNAHANNFIVDNRSQDSFLAAVDFDFAFTEDAFVPGCWEGKDSVFPKDFEGILEFEQIMGLATSLAGSDFTSTGVANNGGFDPTFQLFRILFRDTLVAGYQNGVEKNKISSPQADLENSMQSCKALVTLALIAQSENL